MPMFSLGEFFAATVNWLVDHPVLLLLTFAVFAAALGLQWVEWRSEQRQRDQWARAYRVRRASYDELVEDADRRRINRVRPGGRDDAA